MVYVRPLTERKDNTFPVYHGRERTILQLTNVLTVKLLCLYYVRTIIIYKDTNATSQFHTRLPSKFENMYTHLI